MVIWRGLAAFGQCRPKSYMVFLETTKSSQEYNPIFATALAAKRVPLVLHSQTSGMNARDMAAGVMTIYIAVGWGGGGVRTTYSASGSVVLIHAFTNNRSVSNHIKRTHINYNTNCVTDFITSTPL